MPVHKKCQIYTRNNNTDNLFTGEISTVHLLTTTLSFLQAKTWLGRFWLKTTSLLTSMPLRLIIWHKSTKTIQSHTVRI